MHYRTFSRIQGLCQLEASSKVTAVTISSRWEPLVSDTKWSSTWAYEGLVDKTRNLAIKERMKKTIWFLDKELPLNFSNLVFPRAPRLVYVGIQGQGQPTLNCHMKLPWDYSARWGLLIDCEVPASSSSFLAY